MSRHIQATIDEADEEDFSSRVHVPSDDDDDPLPSEAPSIPISTLPLDEQLLGPPPPLISDNLMTSSTYVSTLIDNNAPLQFQHHKLAADKQLVRVVVVLSYLLNFCFLVPQCRYLLIIMVILPAMDTKGLDSQIILVHLFLLLLLFLMILHVLLQHFKACLYRQYSKTSYHPLTFHFGFAL